MGISRLGTLAALFMAAACTDSFTTPRSPELSARLDVLRSQASVGTACEIDAGLCGSPFGNDHLVVNRTPEYDRFFGDLLSGTFHPPYNNAVLMNHWDGMVPNGSGVVWFYSFMWTGAVCPIGVTLPDGGICWGAGLEMYMSQGLLEYEHFWMAHASHSYRY